MKLWIDDLRTPVEDGWVVARTPGDAVAALESCVASGEVLEWVVYDHDLGLDGNGNIMEVKPVLIWQGFNQVYPQMASVVSSNGPGGDWVRAALRHDCQDGPVRMVDWPDYVSENGKRVSCR